MFFFYIFKGIFKFAIRRISPPNFLDQSSPKKKNLRISKVSIAPTSGNKHYVRPIPGKSAEFRPCEFTNLHYVFKRRVAHRRLSWTTKENRNTSAEINFKSCLPVWLSTRKQKPGNKKYFNYGVEERGTLACFHGALHVTLFVETPDSGIYDLIRSSLQPRTLQTLPEFRKEVGKQACKHCRS